MYWYVCDCAVGGHSVCVYSFAYGVGTLVNIAVCLEQLYHWFFAWARVAFMYVGE